MDMEEKASGPFLNPRSGTIFVSVLLLCTIGLGFWAKNMLTSQKINDNYPGKNISALKTLHDTFFTDRTANTNFSDNLFPTNTKALYSYSGDRQGYQLALNVYPTGYGEKACSEVKEIKDTRFNFTCMQDLIIGVRPAGYLSDTQAKDTITTISNNVQDSVKNYCTPDPYKNSAQTSNYQRNPTSPGYQGLILSQNINLAPPVLKADTQKVLDENLQALNPVGVKDKPVFITGHDLPSEVKIPELPSKPGEAPTSVMISRSVDDTHGPGCGWAFTNTPVPEAKNLSYDYANDVKKLQDTQNQWLNQIQAYTQQVDVFTKNSSAYQNYKQAVDQTMKTWDTISGQYDQYLQAKQDYMTRANSYTTSVENYKKEIQDYKTQKQSIQEKLDACTDKNSPTCQEIKTSLQALKEPSKPAYSKLDQVPTPPQDTTDPHPAAKQEEAQL